MVKTRERVRVRRRKGGIWRGGGVMIMCGGCAILHGGLGVWVDGVDESGGVRVG